MAQAKYEIWVTQPGGRKRDRLMTYTYDRERAIEMQAQQSRAGVPCYVTESGRLFVTVSGDRL